METPNKKDGPKSPASQAPAPSSPVPEGKRGEEKEKELKASKVEAKSAHELPRGATWVFITNLLPENSPRGALCALVFFVSLACAFLFLAAGRKPPSSPFRCDDTTLQAPFLRDRLPTALFLPLLTLFGFTILLLVEFRNPDASPSEASYLAASSVRRLFLGGLIIGNAAFNIQRLNNAKMPHAIESCQTSVFMPDGTEEMVCPCRKMAWTTWHLSVTSCGELCSLACVILGNVAFNIQRLNNAKRPHFIESCQPSVFMPDGTEKMVCPAALTSKTLANNTGTQRKAAGRLFSRRIRELNKDMMAAAMFNIHGRTTSQDSPNNTTGLKHLIRNKVNQKKSASGTVKSLISPSRSATTKSSSVNAAGLTSTSWKYSYNNTRAVQNATASPSRQRSADTHRMGNGGIPGASPDGMIVDYHCSGPNSRKSGGSFPSGHATAGSFVLVFLYCRCVRKLWSFRKPFQAIALGIVLITCTALVCAQRLVYYHHHKIDVLCGFAIGASGAALFAFWPNMDREGTV